MTGDMQGQARWPGGREQERVILGPVYSLGSTVQCSTVPCHHGERWTVSGTCSWICGKVG